MKRRMWQPAQLVGLSVMAMVLTAPLPAVAQQPVRFGRAQVSVGQVITRTDEYTIDAAVKLTVGGTVIDEGTSHVHNITKRTETALKTSGETVTALKVHYDEMNHRSRTVLTEDVDDSGDVKGLLFGTTYLLKSSGGRLEATYENGLSASNRETDVIRDIHDDLGKESKLAAYLNNKVFNVGDRLELPSEAAQDFLHLPDSGLQYLLLILKAVRLDRGMPLAVFDTRVKMTLLLTNHSVSMDLRGETAMRPSGSSIASIMLEGPIATRIVDQIEDRLVMVQTNGTIKIQETNEQVR